MAKKKSRSVAGMIGEVVGDVVDAASVAATGSQLGVLELAAEEEMSPAPARKKRKAKAARRKGKAARKSAKKTGRKTKTKTKGKRAVRRSRR